MQTYKLNQHTLYNNIYEYNYIYQVLSIELSNKFVIGNIANGIISG